MDIKKTSTVILVLFAFLLSFNSCIEIGKVIAVKTNTAENITATGADLSATVVDIGETGLSSYGWCWAEYPEPTTSDNTYDFGTKDKAGNYAYLLSGLNPGKTYYVRSFVSGGGETVYGEQLELTTEALIFTISKPAQGDILGHDMTYQIEWEANTSDKLKIELLQNNVLIETINDETENTGTYPWTVPNTIAESNDYKIAITSIKNESTKAETGNFSILANAPPSVQTDSINKLTYNSVSVFGAINNFGTDYSATQHGYCWALNSNPTITDDKTELGNTSNKGSFSSNITNLNPLTTYYVRAYATNSVGTSYGEEISFTTENVFAPSVTTGTTSNISHNSASVDGTINDFGTDNSATQHGHCWSLSQNPTIADSKTELGSKNTTGDFLSNLTGLTDNTIYYVRAYATNSVGASYGEEISFTTENVFAPSVTTGTTSNISHNSASVDGTINNFGTDNSATQHGHCWSLSQNPTIADSKTELGNKNTTGDFSSNLTNLDASSTYYVKAYATNNAGTSYGTEINFTTNELPLPELTTSAVSDISYTTATSGGEVVADNGYPVTERGVCWSISQNPTLSDSHTTDGSGAGAFSSSLSGLSENTTYYVRAYATSSLGTAYGNQQQFTSLTASAPIVSTTEVSDISFSTATSGGDVTNDNGSPVTDRGVCWSISQNPTLSDAHTTDGVGTGAFSSSITGLMDNTTYYVRAYATNSLGTSYGNQQSFTTLKSLPTVSTDLISNISYNSATSGGNVTYEGASAATSRGICWSILPSPTLSDNYTEDGSDTGIYTSKLLGLSIGTSYYVRAYATNSIGTSYGNERLFSTLSAYTTVTDYDGNTYNAVLIGNQVWMAENLKTTHYANGTSIPLVTDNTDWANLGDNNTERAYCFYNNNTNGEADIYGALYTWAAAMDGASSSSSNPSGIQGVCPSGWHLPSDDEWKEMEMYLGMSQPDADGIDWRGTDEGGMLKAIGTVQASTGLWEDPNTEANNESGFSALPSGHRFFLTGYSMSLSSSGYWWSATENSDTYAWYHILGFNQAGVARSNYHKSSGFSVRCIKD